MKMDGDGDGSGGLGGKGLEIGSGSRMFRVGSKASIEFWESTFLSLEPKNRFDMDPGDLRRSFVSPWVFFLDSLSVESFSLLECPPLGLQRPFVNRISGDRYLGVNLRPLGVMGLCSALPTIFLTLSMLIFMSQTDRSGVPMSF